MKKKIKDLTPQESLQICDKSKSCFLCPLEHTVKCYNTWIENNRLLEREVEVDE